MPSRRTSSLVRPALKQTVAALSPRMYPKKGGCAYVYYTRGAIIIFLITSAAQTDRGLGTSCCPYLNVVTTLLGVLVFLRFFSGLVPQKTHSNAGSAASRACEAKGAGEGSTRKRRRVSMVKATMLEFRQPAAIERFLQERFHGSLHERFHGFRDF